MIRVSRSHIQTRIDCEMKRYHTTEVNGGGVQPLEGEWVKDSQLAVTRGRLIHEMADYHWRGLDWASKLKSECETLFDPTARRIHETLLRRAFLGWLHVRWPFYASHYTVMSSEKEWTWRLSPLFEQPLRMDKILRRNDDGMLGILDFKTMKSADINWVDRMKHDKQTHLYIQALKEKSNEPTMGIAYEGLVLGEWKDGEQKSPLVCGYESKTNKVSPKWTAGTKRVSVLDYSDEAWLRWMLKADVLKDLYPTTGFLLPPNHVLIHTKNSTIYKELDWHARMSNLNNIESEYGRESEEWQSEFETIEKNDKACLKYGWGHACPFYQICWQGMGYDSFEKRKDHHSADED